jgi:hypothetical protein
VTELHSDTGTKPGISDERSDRGSVAPAQCSIEGTRAHRSTYISAVTARPVLTAAAQLAHCGYSGDPRFSLSIPVIFPLCSSDFTDLARVVNTLTLHVVTVI